MSSRSPTVPVDTLRAAARAAVDARKLRPVAKEVGVSPSGLTNFLDRKHDPQKRTLRKLAEWYLRQAPVRAGLTEAELRGYLGLVFRNVPERARERGIERVLRLMAEVHRESGAPLPEWLRPEPKPPG